MYQEAEIEANNDIIDDGDCSKLSVTKVASKSLGDDIHGVRSNSTEDGRANYLP